MDNTCHFFMAKTLFTTNVGKIEFRMVSYGGVYYIGAIENLGDMLTLRELASHQEYDGAFMFWQRLVREEFNSTQTRKKFGIVG